MDLVKALYLYIMVTFKLLSQKGLSTKCDSDTFLLLFYIPIIQSLLSMYSECTVYYLVLDIEYIIQLYGYI